MSGKSLKKIIFVVGPPHSGTTILYRMLAQHPNVCWFSQYSLRGGQIPGRIRLPFYAEFNRLGRGFVSPLWEKEFGLKTKIIPTPSEPHKIWDYVLPTNDVWRTFFEGDDCSEGDALKMRQMCEKECCDWGKGILLVKLPRLSNAVRLLAHVFPESCFLHIVRDGRAVALSNEHKFARTAPDSDIALQQSAEYWSAVEGYLIDTRNVNMKTIKYEDFCADITGNIRDILLWANLNLDTFDFSLIPRLLSVTNDKWIKNLTYNQEKTLNRIMKDELVHFGYLTKEA